MNYKHYQNRPERLTAEFVKEEYAAITSRIAEAEASDSASSWIELFADWNALKSYIGAEGSRLHYAFSKDMNNQELDTADQYYREHIMPEADNGGHVMTTALLQSKHRAMIAEQYGSQIIASLETQVQPLAPVNSDLRVKAGDFSSKYDKAVASGEVVVGGQTVTLAVARAMGSSEDGAVRKEAFEAYRSWFVQHHDELADIYHNLVSLRDQMGKNLGYENYIPLGYLTMGRTDYGVEEATRFRENVRKYAVPLQTAIYANRAKSMGADMLKPWDMVYDPVLSLPSGIAPVDTQLEKAQRVFDALSPRLSAHFTRMRNEGLIDLENRKGKQAGAYCTSFSDEARVAIFCNSTGNQDDVSTLMHEMGHAFQGWESQAIEAVDLQWPTSDACEVHSMGMEYLSMRYMNEFFNPENTDKFRRHRWQEGLELLCYVSIVDEFQHWVYEHPSATPTERDEQWCRIWDIYKPGLDFSGIEAYKFARWYAQGHIFDSPFYYIDYALAETGAMQLALLDAQDHDRAVDTYITLCKIGGTMSVLNIFDAVGLRSPFDESLMRDLMEHAGKELGIEVDEIPVS